MNAYSISPRNKNYPPLLKEVYKPPNPLFYRGRLEVLSKTCISIVGTRKFTEYGEFVTEKIVDELSHLDIAIVSGLAKGIDTIAHKRALEKGLPTIAILGSGINNIYPKENDTLAKQIQKTGLILSEYEDMTEPIARNFPQRNRIISGLSIATIVIECAQKSGALITAKFALDQGREVFTTPGDIDRVQSQGPLQLLQRSAAHPISSGQDIIEVLQKQPHLFENQKTKPKLVEPKSKGKHIEKLYNLTKLQKEILLAIPHRRPKDFGKIQSKIEASTQELLSNLTSLEILGLIKTKNGKYFRTC